MIEAETTEATAAEAEAAEPETAEAETAEAGVTEVTTSEGTAPEPELAGPAAEGHATAAPRVTPVTPAEVGGAGPRVTVDRGAGARGAEDRLPLAVVADTRTAPVAAYLLADHLDAVLAAGEDLLAISSETSECEPEACGRRIADARSGQRHLVERIRGLELTLVSRCLRARERAQELAVIDIRFKQITGLFIGGTAPLADAVAECADATAHDFETGDGILAYLREHGLVAGDTEMLDERAGISVGEDFLVARRIVLGVLLDLVATFLDALELHFELYEVDLEPAADETATAPAVTAEAA